LGFSNNFASNGDADVADPVQFGVESAGVDLVCIDGGAESDSGCVNLMLSACEFKDGANKMAHHLLGYVDSFAENCTQANAGEDIHIAIQVSIYSKTDLKDATETLTFPDWVASPFHRAGMVGTGFHLQRWLFRQYISWLPRTCIQHYSMDSKAER